MWIWIAAPQVDPLSGYGAPASTKAAGGSTLDWHCSCCVQGVEGSVARENMRMHPTKCAHVCTHGCEHMCMGVCTKPPGRVRAHQCSFNPTYHVVWQDAKEIECSNRHETNYRGLSEGLCVGALVKREEVDSKEE
eukprot:scaffold117267_cov23-Tisochrysis_lutea.AAC.1